MSDGVIILHGIFRTHRSMRGLAGFLEKSGFRILNLDYPSTKHSIETLADVIQHDITQFASQISGQLHFVGYSMGGLLIRAYLNKYRPEKLSRVVMIGTPNQGSEVADFLQAIKLYRWLYGPAGQQLITKQDNFLRHFGKVDYELGIIAGNKPIDPISSCIIRKPNDGKVSIESTKLDGVKEHIILPCSHTFFPSNREMWAQVLHFLKTGLFTPKL
jgi:pimeloyl-ACP methyl ester carboxylesterase